MYDHGLLHIPIQISRKSRRHTRNSKQIDSSTFHNVDGLVPLETFRDGRALAKVQRTCRASRRHCERRQKDAKHYFPSTGIAGEATDAVSPNTQVKKKNDAPMSLKLPETKCVTIRKKVLLLSSSRQLGEDR